MLKGMGWATDIELEDPRQFADALSHLGAGLHSLQRDPSQPAFSRIFDDRAPELWLKAKRTKSHDDAVSALWTLLANNLRSSLVALILIADRATQEWAAAVQLGGRTRDAALHELFTRLSQVYRSLFAQVPTLASVNPPLGNERQTIPGGPSVEWHIALIRLVADRAQGLLAKYSATEGAEALAPEAVTGLRHLIALAKWSDGVRQGRPTGSRDGVAHHIRQANVARAARERSGR
ncbi:hypothetical protein [Belnapia mucosa]|uniref:hypothetical protein n=1 Tax=Belnapia mucosa TaxID=2804532 RepID=UPI001F371D1A|nr:hypothetical protein [Belnapia mucosa]